MFVPVDPTPVSARPRSELPDLPREVTLRAAIVLLALCAVAALGQTPEERLAFDAAVRALESGFADKAAADLAEFVAGNPASPLVPQAILLEARSRAQIGQLDAAADLLVARLESLGPLKDQALYLLGDVNLRRNRFQEAEQAFRRLAAEFPESSLLLKAGFSQALALFRGGDPAAAASLLANPTNAFARAAAAAPNHETTIRGRLLLAEARWKTGDIPGAREALESLANRPLTPEQAWSRQWLQSSLFQAEGRVDAALTASSNLFSIATTIASADLLARSHVLRGDILGQAGRTAEAFAAYTNDLVAGVPSEWRRDALLAIAQLPLNTPQLDPAISLLRAMADRPEKDATTAAARIAVAELRLQQYFEASPGTGTNLLREAEALLNSALSNAPPRALEGRAWFNVGWTRLEDGTLASATESFARAAEHLETSSPLRSLAVFKLADCQQKSGNDAAALTNYLRVVRPSSGVPAARGALLERALYQGTLAAIGAGKSDIANELARRAVVEFPNGEFRDDTRVLYGQTLARLAPAPGASEVLRQLSTQLTNSPALPEIQLAVARSYLREGSWSNAMQQLDDWIRSYPNHTGIARTQFERAWAVFKTGDEARSYGLFTNFLSRFPNDPAAPQAQVWVGNYLGRQGNYVAAESSYQLVFQRTNWPVSRLTYEARLLAGRAAFLRQGYKDARTNYFGWLIANGPPAVTNSPVPPELVAQAYFALGDCFLQDPEGDDKLSFAMTAFARLIETFPNTREAFLARGRLAECHLQRAALDPAQAPGAYTNAAVLYLDLIKDASDPAARSEAEVGLGVLREKQAAGPGSAEASQLLQEALAHYLNVFTGRNLKPGETGSPFWINRAGLEAARLAESMGRSSQAASLYESLATTFPASAQALRQRAAQIRGR